MPRRTIILAACAALVVSGLGASTSAAAVTPMPTATTTDGIQQLLADVNTNPTVFTGIYEDPATHVVHLRYKSSMTLSGELMKNFKAANPTPATTASGAISTPADAWTISYDPSPYSAAELQQVTDWLGDNFSPTSGIEQYSIDPSSGTVALGISDPASPVLATVLSLFPGQISTFTDTERAQPFANRKTDGVPWTGGDSIVSATNGCTAGFRMKVGSAYYMETAGHCTGTSWDQGYQNPGQPVVRNGFLGSEYTRQYGNGRVDAMLLKGSSYASFIWKGTNSSPVKTHVTGATGVVMNSSVCFEGAVTGESCGGRVTAVGVCRTIGSTNECFQNVATKSSRLATDGDSGGPVIQVNSGGVGISGSISGGNSAGTEVEFSDIGKIDQIFGGAPAT